MKHLCPDGFPERPVPGQASAPGHRFSEHTPWLSAGYLVNRTARLFAAGLQERIKPLGLTIGCFFGLLELCIRDGATQRELLEKLA